MDSDSSHFSPNSHPSPSFSQHSSNIRGDSETKIRIFDERKFSDLQTHLDLLKKQTQEFIQKIKNGYNPTGNTIGMELCLLLTDYNEAKNELFEVLQQWKKRQQELSINCFSKEDICSITLREALNIFEQQFDVFCEILITMKTFLIELKQTIGTSGNDLSDSINQGIPWVNKMHEDILKNGIVISNQSPSIVTLFQERREKGQRRSRFWFDMEIKLLGAKTLPQSANSAISNLRPTLEIVLLTDPQNAKDEFSDDKFEKMKFEVVCESSKYDPSSGLLPLKDIRVYYPDRRPFGVKKRRYALRCALDFDLFGSLTNVNKFSLPFALIIEGSPGDDLKTAMFMERCFASNLVQQIEDAESSIEQKGYALLPLYTDLKDHMLEWKVISGHKTRILEALELKFNSYLEKRLHFETKLEKTKAGQSKIRSISSSSSTSVDFDNSILKIRPFSDEDRDHIWDIIKSYKPEVIPLQEECECSQCFKIKNDANYDFDAIGFENDEIQLDVLYKHITAIQRDEQKRVQPCTFLEWFFKTAEMAGLVIDSWNSTKIYGFCTQQKSTDLLLTSLETGPKILIRFADTAKAQFRLSMNNYQGEVRHWTVKYSEAKGRARKEDTFADERSFWHLIESIAENFNIYIIYPNFRINVRKPEIPQSNGNGRERGNYMRKTYALYMDMVRSAAKRFRDSWL